MSRNQYAAIHIARKSRGLDDDTYRELLKRETGKTSLRLMTDDELGKVRRSLGAASPHKGRALTGAYAKKLQALWLSGWNLGVIRDKRDTALLAFIKNQTGIERTEFLRDSEDSFKVIEALKSMLTREAGVNWYIPPSATVPTFMKEPRYSVIVAQVMMLMRLGLEPQSSQIQKVVIRTAGTGDLGKLNASQWVEIQLILGARIRNARKGGA